jgi:hypothetical protein
VRIVSRVCIAGVLCAMDLVYWVVVFWAPAARSPDLVDLAVIAGLPVLGVAIFVFLTWSDRWTVVEFTCDDEEFRYRRFAQTSWESRCPWEVQAITSDYSYGRRSYAVRFLDGSEVCLRSALSNVEILAERLQCLRRLTSR